MQGQGWLDADATRAAPGYTDLGSHDESRFFLGVKSSERYIFVVEFN